MNRPSDDVRELLREARGMILGDIEYDLDEEKAFIARIDTALSQTGDQPDTDGSADWQFLRDTVTPSPFPHNEQAWSVMWRLIEKRITSRTDRKEPRP